MSRFFMRTVLFLAFFVLLMGTAMWILNGAEVGSFISLVESILEKTGLNLGEHVVNI